jgi:4'-phosphopantetheinyl transferase
MAFTVTMQQSPLRHSDWKSVASLPPLEREAFQVWRLELTDDNSLLPICLPLLTAEEQIQAERRRAGRVREEFAAGRACLRILLSNIFAVEPCDVPLIVGPYGKPTASVDGRSLSFNVTHSRGVILIALSENGDVGIDVERVDPAIDVMEVARSAFGPHELRLLEAIRSPEERRLAFYRCWTQKEAIIKADGRGLSLPLSCFEVPVSPAWLTPVQIHEPDQPKKLYLLSEIALEGDAIGAIATDSHNCRMTWLNFPLSAFNNRL